MAFEEMLEGWEKFNHTAEEESTKVDVDQHTTAITSKSLGFSLIEKLLAPRIISGEVMRKTFKAAWNIPSGLIVEKLGTNLFLFSLRSEEELARVMRQGPWLFDKFLLVLSKPIPMVKPTTMEFKYATFWVHFCELPMDLYNLSMVERLSNAIGRFEEYDNGGRGFDWKESLQVRVTLDISKPLHRGINVKLEEPLGNCWTPIRYEKLPDLCSYCGRIGHSVKGCGSFYLADGSPSKKHQYGMWMNFSGRSSSLFRLPSTSPLEKNSIMVDITTATHSSPVDGQSMQVHQTAGTGDVGNASPIC